MIPYILSILIGLRLFFFKPASQIQFIEESTGSAVLNTAVVVEVSGSIVKPGVYSFSKDSRIQDLLVQAGGLSEKADRSWVSKYLNLAARLSDGSKIYIPSVSESIKNKDVLGSNNTSNDIININKASSAELDTLPGIGAVTAEKIISGRPYTTIDELLTKKIVSKSVYEKIKDKIATY
jgi:competence protein ComEA